MASLYPPAMRRLITELTKLPSIGERSAVRLAYHLLTRKPLDARSLAQALEDALRETKLCRVCFFLSDSEVCPICQDQRRDIRRLCVVEKPADVLALEQSGGYRGLYHVLHGSWSPLKGIGPEKTKLGELILRLKGEERFSEDPLAERAEEVILATSTTVEGDATALYIASAVESLGITVTRIAQGLPKGGELEYADQMTLHLSLEGRRKI
jgi:recombination protein RecR